MNNIKTYYAASSETVEPLCIDDLSPGMLCVAKYSVNSEWYRAKILSIISEEQVLVVFIDYGTQESVAVCNVQCLKEKFMSESEMSVLCSLDSCNDTDDDTTIRFQQLVSQRTFLAEVISVYEVSDMSEASVKYSVKLLDMGMSVADQLADVLLTKAISVIVTSVTSPNDFWCRIEDESTELPLLMDRIADLCARGNDVSKSVDLTPGSICVAKYSDDIWYRARIISRSVSVVPNNVSIVSASNEEADPSAIYVPAVDASNVDTVKTCCDDEDSKDTDETSCDDEDSKDTDETSCDDANNKDTVETSYDMPDTESDVSLPDVLRTDNDQQGSGDSTPSVCDDNSLITVQVLFIDYGNTATVFFSDLRPLPSDYLVLPPQAVHCSLTSLLPQVGGGDALWDEASCNRFVELVTCRDDGHALQLRPSRVVRDQSGYIVELFGRLFDGDNDVGLELVNGGYAVNSAIELPSSGTNVKQRRSSSLLEHERCNVFVSPLQDSQDNDIGEDRHAGHEVVEPQESPEEKNNKVDVNDVVLSAVDAEREKEGSGNDGEKDLVVSLITHSERNEHQIDNSNSIDSLSEGKDESFEDSFIENNDVELEFQETSEAMREFRFLDFRLKLANQHIFQISNNRICFWLIH